MSEARGLLVSMTFRATESALFAKFVMATFDKDRLSIHDCIGDRQSCMLNNPAERCAGNLHLCSCPLLCVGLEIGQAKGFELINGKDNFFKRREWYSSGLEISGPGFE